MKIRLSPYLQTSIVLMGFGLSWPAFAAHEGLDEITVVEAATIIEIRTETVLAVVTYSADTIPFSGCDEGATPHVVIDWKVNKDKKVMYNAALSAHLLNKSVNIGLRGCKRGLPKALWIEVK